MSQLQTKRKTIAEYMVEVLKENNVKGVMWGDCGLLDFCAEKCTHTNLMEQHPMDRHQRILGALQKSKLFDTKFIDLPMKKRGNSTVRVCMLKKIENKKRH